MFERLSTDKLNWIIMISVVLFIMEFSFFNSGLIFSALFSGICIYIGWKHFTEVWGKVLFWVGIVSLTFSILNMMAVRFLIIVVLIMLIIHYIKSKEDATHIEPQFLVHEQQNQEQLYQKTPLFPHRFWGAQKTADTAYGWKDINIHSGVGDRVIDLSHTVLPEDTAIISIRHILGNIEIYVPYEVEVSIHHSAIFGKAYILGNPHHKLVNETLLYETEEYRTKQPRVKVITSLISGDIEVKRI